MPKKNKTNLNDSGVSLPPSNLNSIRYPQLATENGSSNQPGYCQDSETIFTKDNPFQSGSKLCAAGNRRPYTISNIAKHPLSRSGNHLPKDESETRRLRHKATVGYAASNCRLVSSTRSAKLEERGRTAAARRTRRKKQNSSCVVKAALWTISLAIFGTIATIWRQQKLQVGYCGIGEPSTTMLGRVNIPEWVSMIQPQCEPCPRHAICYEDLKTICELDYTLKPHPLSASGLIPLPPTCEPKCEIVCKNDAVAEFEDWWNLASNGMFKQEELLNNTEEQEHREKKGLEDDRKS